MTWLFLPSKCTPEQPCWEKVSAPLSTTWASTIAPSATLNGKHTRPAFWLRAWKKDPWMRHLSGPMHPLLTQQRGITRYLESLPDSPAKISQLPEIAQGLTGNEAANSLKSCASLLIAVRGGCFWRTSQLSLLPPPPLWTKPRVMFWNAPLPESWGNWPTSGGTRNGSLYQRPTWVPAMAGRDGSVSPGAWERWDTPDTMPEMPNSGSNRKAQPAGLGNQARIVTNWATPDCNTATYSNGKFGPNIRQQAKNWATPQASDEKRDRGTMEQKQRWSMRANSSSELSIDVALWPTPNVPNGGRTLAAEYVASKGMTPDGKRQVGLEMAVRHWPTPAARDGKGVNSEEHATMTGGGRKHMDQLANFVAFSRPAQTILAGLPSSKVVPNSPRHLNPLFGAWLMGWPSTWVIAEPNALSALETASWRSALQSHLSFLLNDQNYLKKCA